MACRRERTADGGDKKWKLFDREPPLTRASLPRITIHTRHAEKDGEAKKRSARSGQRDGRRGYVCPRGGCVGSRAAGVERCREDGPGYSVHKRATVHTPKRVFVRFHFTPNYLAHIGRTDGGKERE